MDEMTIIDIFLKKCVKNHHLCQHCVLNHDGICFFAFGCFIDDMRYFTEED